MVSTSQYDFLSMNSNPSVQAFLQQQGNPKLLYSSAVAVFSHDTSTLTTAAIVITTNELCHFQLTGKKTSSLPLESITTALIYTQPNQQGFLTLKCATDQQLTFQTTTRSILLQLLLQLCPNIEMEQSTVTLPIPPDLVKDRATPSPQLPLTPPKRLSFSSATTEQEKIDLVDEQAAEIAQLQNTLAEKELRSEAIDSSLKDALKMLRQRDADITKLQSQLAQMQARAYSGPEGPSTTEAIHLLKEKEDKINQLQELVEDLEAECKAKENMQSTLQQEITELNAIQARASPENLNTAETMHLLQQKETQIDELQELIEQLKSQSPSPPPPPPSASPPPSQLTKVEICLQTDMHMGHIEALKKKLSSMKAAHERISQSNEENTDLVQKLKMKCASLETNLSRSTTKTELLRKDLAVAQVTNVEIQEDIKALLDSLNSHTVGEGLAAVANLHKEQTSLLETVSTLQNSLTEANQQLAKLQKQHQQYIQQSQSQLRSLASQSPAGFSSLGGNTTPPPPPSSASPAPTELLSSVRTRLPQAVYSPTEQLKGVLEGWPCMNIEEQKSVKQLQELVIQRDEQVQTLLTMLQTQESSTNSLKAMLRLYTQSGLRTAA
eukprot:TRINITY_DN56759_c0_g1_i1.p1 TRINITY_DN56759_c0_g1~~TRINITY_DN56759_c0_g1_i1.p1  ORF type:complete len:610 (+),score=82.10 TRINITY_DN56759_c0_g1_i1:16-1845(+)